MTTASAPSPPTDEPPYRGFVAPSLREPPPRHLPAGLRLVLLLGGPLGALGWFQLTASSLWLWIFSTQVEAQLVALFRFAPLVGLGIVLVNAWRGRRAMRLLERGLVTRGHVVARREVPLKAKPLVPVIELVFEFATAAGEQGRVVVKTQASAALLDEESAQIVYDPRHPARAFVLDALPGLPRVDAQGRLAPTSPWALLAAIALPLFFVMANLGAATWTLVR